MSRTTSIAAVLLVLLAGCQRDGANFKTLTDRFIAAEASGVSKIELLPIREEGSRKVLNGSVKITDNVTVADIAKEISFGESPKLPKAMEHAGAENKCKMIIHFRDTSAFALHLSFRSGPSGSGIEYALYPDVNRDLLAHEETLPGNHSLGRGYSVILYGLLQEAIKADGKASWDPTAWK